MNNDHMDSRIRTLERDVTELRTLREVIHGMDKKLDRLAEREDLEPRLRVLEDERNKAVGGFKTLVFIGSIVGALAGWGFGKLTSGH